MSLVAIVGSDLLIGTRIADAAVAAGHEVVRVDEPAALPPVATVSIVFVDWSERGPDWAADLRSWIDRTGPASQPRLVVFGPHTDLVAHADARAAGIGPMLARSKLVTDLRQLLG